MPKTGVIGGSGLYDIPGLVPAGEVTLDTPYGSPSDSYRRFELDGMEIYFLPRHGREHAVPPHRINYKANIWGFKKLEVERIIAVNATGGIDPALPPGTVVIPDQIIDFTQGARPSTFYGEKDVVHVDFSYPFCPESRESLRLAAQKAGIEVKYGGTYVCVNGPRLESAAEIRFFRGAGGDLVGMTAMPEAVLARELEICYAGLSVITNYAAGVEEDKKLTTTEVLEVMGKSTEALKAVLKEAFPLLPPQRACPCADALRGSRL